MTQRDRNINSQKEWRNKKIQTTNEITTKLDLKSSLIGPRMGDYVESTQWIKLSLSKTQKQKKSSKTFQQLYYGYWTALVIEN